MSIHPLILLECYRDIFKQNKKEDSMTQTCYDHTDPFFFVSFLLLQSLSGLDQVETQKESQKERRLIDYSSRLQIENGSKMTSTMCWIT
ncbi:hypothetical protein HAX54_038469 [Datura stramonium]|uniref:Uncharacterized protein n=1 Tax=Datura stramonium TaxID=4076 RepID=A0ABS8VNT7_DATST|nr:hypothetical protein [Datura stramonium]